MTQDAFVAVESGDRTLTTVLGEVASVHFPGSLPGMAECTYCVGL